MLRYLGHYTHRVAISNHRLVALDHERVTFRWNDRARANPKRLTTLVEQSAFRERLTALKRRIAGKKDPG